MNLCGEQRRRLYTTLFGAAAHRKEVKMHAHPEDFYRVHVVVTTLGASRLLRRD